MVNDKKGAALIAALFVVLLGVTLGTIFVFRASTDITIAFNHKKSVQSLYAAAAGIEKALWELKVGNRGPTWRPANFSGSLSGGSYNFSITDHSGSEIEIISTGNIGASTKTIQQRSLKIDVFYLNSLVSNGDISLTGAQTSFFFWTWNSYLNINGPVTTAGSINIGTNTTINGTQTEGATVNMPGYPNVGVDVDGDGDVDARDDFIGYYTGWTDGGGTYHNGIVPNDGNHRYTGDQNFNPGTGHGLDDKDIIFVGDGGVGDSGDVNILINAGWWGGGAKDLTVVATGDINISLPANGSDDRCTLISWQDTNIPLDLGSWQDVNLIIYANQNVDIKYGGAINGTIVAGGDLNIDTVLGIPSNIDDRIITYDSRIETDLPLGLLLPPPSASYYIGAQVYWSEI